MGRSNSVHCVGAAWTQVERVLEHHAPLAFPIPSADNGDAEPSTFRTTRQSTHRHLFNRQPKSRITSIFSWNCPFRGLYSRNYSNLRKWHDLMRRGQRVFFRNRFRYFVGSEMSDVQVHADVPNTISLANPRGNKSTHQGGVLWDRLDYSEKLLVRSGQKYNTKNAFNFYITQARCELPMKKKKKKTYAYTHTYKIYRELVTRSKTCCAVSWRDSLQILSPSCRSSEDAFIALQVLIRCPIPQISASAPWPSWKTSGECISRVKELRACVGGVAASSQSMRNHFDESLVFRITLGHRISRWNKGIACVA